MMVIQPLKRSSGNYVRNGGFALAIVGSRVRNKPCQRPDPPKRRLIQPQQAFFTVFHPMGLHFGGHTTANHARAAANRGNCTTRGFDTPATRRKKASCSAKPPSQPPEVRRIAYKTWAQHRLARKTSPNTSPPVTFPRQSSPRTAPPAALPRKSSPSMHKNAEFGPF